LALEMATALLLAESSLENFQSLDEDFARSADAVVNRLGAVGRGEELGLLELPHLDAMSRRAQERLLLESVAREIRTNLGAIEQTLDAFFRDTSRQSTLAALKQPIQQIQGALLVLGQDRANDILAECAKAIEHFATEGFAPQAGDFEDVAKKLSALGFFVTQLQSGSADIDAILEPRPPAHPVREEVEAPAPAASSAPELPSEAISAEVEPGIPAGIEETGGEALPDFEVEGLAPPPEPTPTPAPAPVEAPAPSEEASRLVDASQEDLDAELLSIFLEEAREVLATINQHLPQLHAAPGDHDALVTVRRSFHTLKGSGRMVGLAELGEAAWAVEQVLNGWLHVAQPASPALLDMLDLAAGIFTAWVDQLEGGGSSHLDAAELIHRCNILGGTEDVDSGRAIATSRCDTAGGGTATGGRRLPKQSPRKSSRKPSRRPRSYPSPRRRRSASATWKSPRRFTTSTSTKRASTSPRCSPGWA
jgi:chemosensory pili system protein ChpA (sensor histidine kinase/response regulator)